ncbi:hypothetical protein WJX79_000382 [Trebouxia sp. C0005]
MTVQAAEAALHTARTKSPDKATPRHKALHKASSPHKDQLEQQLSGNSDPEVQEVQNLPFESARVKAGHYHWSDNCSHGIQQMLAGRQQRHDASLQAFFTVRNKADAELHATVAEHASDCKQQLKISTANIEAMLSNLSDDNVMQLEEPEVHKVWEDVLQQMPARAEFVSQLGQSAEAAEQLRKGIIDRALLEMTHAMNDIAHLSPGEVERLIEQQAIELNLSMLDNRKVYTTLMQQLMIAEVKAEEAWHARFEMTKQEFQSGNMSQETGFQDAVTAVQQAASEKELDERVSVALGDLDSIEAGYRAYHATAESSGRSWAGKEEVAATEELEAQLRSHRPRAGRVEEEVRQARAVELIAQKRLLDLHMRSQGKALGRQQQEVAAAVAAAAEVRRQWLAKLAGMEQLLYSAQSAQFLDIRKREAEAFKEKLGRDLAAQTVKLTETVTASTDIAKLQQLMQPQAAERNDLAFCKQVMEAAVALRAGLHTRAQVLQLVKAPIIACDPVDLSLLNQSLDVQVTASAPVSASIIESGAVSMSAQIEAAVKACEAETARVGQDYYSALSASSPTAAKGSAVGKSSAPAKGKFAREEPAAPAEGGSTRPERIPATLTALQELNSKILQDLQQQLQDHLAACYKQFRAQVVTVYRLLELVPSVVTTAFTQHELVAAAAAHQALAAPIEQQHQQLLQHFDGHKKALRPSMAQPSRQSEVTALSSAEQERSAQAVQLGQGHTQAALQLMSLQGPAMRAKLVQLTQLLLRLLDGFVMPADLIGSAEDLREALTRGQSSGSVTMASSATADLSSPQRRSLKQLQALALAAAEAGGEAVQGSPAGKTPAAGGKPASAGKAAAKGSAKDAAADSSRSYVACQWHLPPPLLTLQDLGWSASDTEALCPSPAQGLLGKDEIHWKVFIEKLLPGHHIRGLRANLRGGVQGGTGSVDERRRPRRDGVGG